MFALDPHFSQVYMYSLKLRCHKQLSEHLLFCCCFIFEICLEGLNLLFDIIHIFMMILQGCFCLCFLLFVMNNLWEIKILKTCAKLAGTCNLNNVRNRKLPHTAYWLIRQQVVWDDLYY